MESSLPSAQIPADTNDDQNKFSLHEFQDIISTLPSTDDLVPGVTYRQYQGFWHANELIPKVMSIQQRFQAKSTDIIVASPPKAGTTWLKALTFAIATRHCFDDSTSPLLVKVPHACVPFLEFDLVERKDCTTNPDIPLVSTHLPYTSLPKSIVQERCKIIYIWRDIKDTFVSHWFFFLNTLKAFHAADQVVPMEEAFERFCEGVSVFGPYWDHVLSYWKAKLENPDTILFLKYEDLMKDTALYVKKLAEFMGFPFSIEEEENGAVQKVVDLCSFDRLRNLEVNKSGTYEINSRPFDNNGYFRKAKVGDWSNCLTPEMGARLDLIMEEKLKDSGLTI